MSMCFILIGLDVDVIPNIYKIENKQLSIFLSTSKVLNGETQSVSLGNLG